jgi:NAD(P)-dependent dehydrogenase (short-subunit alcohol dehydrogenase family)
MNDKVACVAGGTSGIGKSLVLALVNRQYNVVAIGKGNEHANELNREVGTLHKEKFMVRVGDLRSPDIAQSIANDIRGRYERLDLLVNAAGTISGGGIQIETFEEWQTVVTTNLHCLFTLTKECLPLLRKGSSPCIVNVSSVCSLRPCASLSYSVSKAGTDMFTKVLARELAPLGIRVNAVNPGVVRSNLQFSAGLFKSEDEYTRWANEMILAHPLGRIGEPIDVTKAILFLASDEANWITGAVLSVDGGRAIA